MNISFENFNFDIENGWLTKAEMVAGERKGGHYEYQSKEGDSREIVIVLISEIDPNIRGTGVPIFKDGKVDGELLTAEQRVLNILRAIKLNTKLPPVEVTENEQGAYKYKLYHGCHRLHCSIAAGFDTIPAVKAIRL